MSGEIWGRDEELRFLDAVLDQTADRLAAVVLEGEAGIGKSTLGVQASRRRMRAVCESFCRNRPRWSAASPMPPSATCSRACSRTCCRRCRRRGAGRSRWRSSSRMLQAAPIRARSASPFGVGRSRGAGPGRACDRRRPVDRSACALAFALRRLREQPILLLLARRRGEGAETSVLEDAVPSDRGAAADRPDQSRCHAPRPAARLGRTFLEADAPARTTFRAETRMRSSSPASCVRTSTRCDRSQSRNAGRFACARLDELPPARAGRSCSLRSWPSLRGASRWSRRRRGGARTRVCRSRDRARGKDDSLHAPAARVGGLPGCGRGRATARTRARCTDRRRSDLARVTALSTESPDTEVAAALEDAAALANARGAAIAAAERRRSRSA